MEGTQWPPKDAHVPIPKTVNMCSIHGKGELRLINQPQHRRIILGYPGGPGQSQRWKRWQKRVAEGRDVAAPAVAGSEGAVAVERGSSH